MEEQLKPGRELDALLAERVFGYEVKWLDYATLGGPEGKDPYVPLGDVYEGTAPFDGGQSKVVPHYSTDIAAAWEVVNKWNAQPNHCCNVAWNITIDGVKDYWSAAFWEDNLRARYIANGETAPHAICLAALKTVASQKKGD